MSLLLLYWGIMIACYAAASKLRHKKETFRFTEQLTNIVIYILVFLMGLRMGANEEVTSNLGSIGLQAAGITVFVVGGSILAVHIARKPGRSKRVPDTPSSVKWVGFGSPFRRA